MLDAEEKTVARLLTESVDDGTSQLRIQPLRGYDADGRSDCAAAGAGRRVHRGLDDAVRRRVDPCQSQPRQREPPDAQLQPETSAAVAIAKMLTGFAAAIEENVPGTIAAIDTEFLHDLRVAVRRTRSILKLVGDVLPDDSGRAIRPGIQVAGRSDHPGPRSRRLPARTRLHGSPADVGRPRRPRPVPVLPGQAPQRRTAAPGARAALEAVRAI